MSQMKKKNYRFGFITSQLDHPGLTGFLEDSYLGTSTAVNLNGTTYVNFNVTGDPNSSASNRFRVVFRSLGPLPVTFSKVKAYPQGNNIMIEWEEETESNIHEYTIEKSADGQTFSRAGFVSAKTNNNRHALYQWLDLQAVTGANYYRIRSAGFSGEILYSNIVKVNMIKAAGDMRVYPNPVVNNRINLYFINQPAGMYKVKLINNAGQVLLIKEFTHSEGNCTEEIKLNKSFSHGNYLLEVTKPDNTKMNIKALY